MSEHALKVDLLVVDDRPDNLVAIGAALDRLGENVVTATSGRDALRHLLERTFAVILLDINMPGMDGFETAELIRRYRPSRFTPIIFMTATGDGALLGQSYALGAVDYLMTPVVPEVLRSKVRVFVDLFRKTQEVERQAAALAQHAAQLERLAAASLTLSSARSLDAIVQAIADTARHVVDAHQATATVTVHAGVTQRAVSFSERYSALPDHRPDGGLVTAPLTEGDGRLMGIVQVSDKREGEFTEADEAALVQLSQLGAITIQNCLHAEAREANRLKDEFLATLSHELRTPLHALLGWTRVLRTAPPDPARIARGLEVIERNVHLQTSLIDELLDVSRIATGKLRIEVRPVPLAPIVEGAMDALRPAADARGVALRATLGDDAGSVLGDAERLHQVFSNLVGNAVKFTSRGGRVDVVVMRWGADVEVQVVDTGVGIRPDFLPFVFDRFRQADNSISRAQGGLGLGLSVVHHLVELHGGSVRAESPGPDQGSTFVVRLPRLVDSASLPEAAPPSAETPLPAEAPSATAGPGERPTAPSDAEAEPASGVHTLVGLRVLVVDDDDDARELLREVLQQRQAQVITASSAGEALDAIDAQRPHVLVSDVAMKGEDGYELIRRVRIRPPQQGGRVPALALTAYARKEDRLRALEAGFQMHASKPIEPTELVAAVATLACAEPQET